MTSVKRVAVCLAGQPRQGARAFENVNEMLIKPSKADVFIHFWTSLEGRVSQNSSAQGRQSAQETVELYQPKIFKIEEQIDFVVDSVTEGRAAHRATPGAPELDPDKGRWGWGFNTLSKTYSIKECQGFRQEYERQNNFTYDVVIHCRSDWGYAKPFNPEHCSEEDCIYITWDWRDPRPAEEGTHGCDNFVHGSSKIMDVFAKTYDAVLANLNTPGSTGASGEVSMLVHIKQVLGPDKIRRAYYNWGDRGNADSWPLYP